MRRIPANVVFSGVFSYKCSILMVFLWKKMFQIVLSHKLQEGIIRNQNVIVLRWDHNWRSITTSIYFFNKPTPKSRDHWVIGSSSPILFSVPCLNSSTDNMINSRLWCDGQTQAKPCWSYVGLSIGHQSSGYKRPKQ